MLDPGPGKAVPVIVPGPDCRLVISSAWVKINVHKVHFFGVPGDAKSGASYVGTQFMPKDGLYTVDPGRPLVLDVPAGAISAEINYSYNADVDGNGTADKFAAVGFTTKS